MQFIVLGYLGERRRKSVREIEQVAIVDEGFAHGHELAKKADVIEIGSGRQSARKAKTLRRNSGKLVVTDGPFTETKELLGGIGRIEPPDMDTRPSPCRCAQVPLLIRALRNLC